ncbi:hypothetical protein [Phycicoccus flavus]|uniref:hypothetical protein n=1 Tax=Phycicoccus flavus TaxID=2502783 RepID=UPI000FEBF496|nr:hypothetical protein [Phycicoccus flavus]NHA69129.1 hypothetical protein [Phycicoccus flavus]
MSEHDGGAPEEIERFGVRQRITMMVNRYEVRRLTDTGDEGELLAFAEQKRMKLKEEVTFFATEAKTRPLFAFNARKRLDLASAYDVTDPSGAPIGVFRKDFKASLLSSTWHLETTDGQTFTGSERSTGIAVLRRVWDFVPVVGEIPLPFLFHFDFRAPDGTVVMSSTKKMGVRDVYRIELRRTPTGRRLDWRLAAAMAVALDALQSR